MRCADRARRWSARRVDATDARTAADYLLAPVTAYFRRAMREPL
jgi:hypothetical protein